MGLYGKILLPFLLDKATGTSELAACRREMLAPARGRVLEIGFGTGLNALHYPHEVERVVAIDPNYTSDKRARRRIERASVPIELRRAFGEDVPAESSSFDTVVTSLVLCSVADAARTLAEVRRVLKPGGRYLFLEHGWSDDPAVQKWQRRLNGLHRRMVGGCHLDRPIRALIEQAGFRFETVRVFYLEKGPRFTTFMTIGSALPAAPWDAHAAGAPSVTSQNP